MGEKSHWSENSLLWGELGSEVTLSGNIMTSLTRALGLSFLPLLGAQSLACSAGVPQVMLCSKGLTTRKVKVGLGPY